MEVNQSEATPQSQDSTDQEQTTETIKNPEAVLAKNKELLSKMATSKEELEQLRTWKKDQEMAVEEKKGNYENVIKSLRDELTETKGALKTKEQSFAWNSVENQIKQAAIKAECKNPEKLMKLIDKGDLKSLEIGEDYSINSDDLNRLMEKAKKENDFLFGTKTLNINDVAPTGRPDTKVDVSAMSAAQYKEHVRNTFK